MSLASRAPYAMLSPQPNRALHYHPRVAGNTLRGVSDDSLSLFRAAVLTGQSSAASLPTGPVMAEPFISPFGLTICVATESALVPRETPIYSSCHASKGHNTLTKSGFLLLQDGEGSPLQHCPRNTGIPRPASSTACFVAPLPPA